MITQKDILCYANTSLSRGAGYLYIAPHKTLRPYISCYTVTFPTDMSDAYTVLPTASSTIVMSVNENSIVGGLRGVNTKSCKVGEHANKMRFLLLIEFRPGCLYPFMKIDQFELVDSTFPLHELDTVLMQTIESQILEAENVDDLIHSVDRILIGRLKDCFAVERVSGMMKAISIQNGNTSTRYLSTEFYYSEKQIRRLFLQCVGTTPKVYSRIIRVNYALRLMKSNNMGFADVAVKAWYFDQPHLIHDFKAICGITPQQYMQNMSVFYNDEYKL